MTKKLLLIITTKLFVISLISYITGFSQDYSNRPPETIPVTIPD